MRIRHSHSSIKKTCIVCARNTGASKIYEEGGISIRVPVCSRDERECSEKVIVKTMATMMIRQLKNEILEVSQ